MLQATRVRQLDRYDDFYDSLLRIAVRQQQMPGVTAQFGGVSEHLFGAFWDGEVVGFLRLSLQTMASTKRAMMFQGEHIKEGVIVAFGVQRTERREGLGSLLLSHAVSVAQARGAAQLRIVVPDDPILHQLFLARGAVVCPLPNDQFAYIEKL